VKFAGRLSEDCLVSTKVTQKYGCPRLLTGSIFFANLAYWNPLKHLYTLNINFMKRQLLLFTLIFSLLGGFSSFRGMAQAVELPFSDDFESYEDTDDFLTSSGWTIIDGDGDGRNWALLYDDVDGIKVMESESYGGGGALTPENYLVTPLLNLPVSDRG
jgi:hypothetical protein